MKQSEWKGILAGLIGSEIAEANKGNYDCDFVEKFVEILLAERDKELREKIKNIKKPTAMVDGQGNYDPEARAHINGFEQAMFNILSLFNERQEK